MTRYILLLLALFVGIVLADFDTDDVEDTYILVYGNRNDCPGEIEFEDDERSLEADEIELNDRDCRGGRINLDRNPSGTRAEKFFRDRSNDVGDFLAGPVTADIICGPDQRSNKLFSGERIILLETEEDVRFRFSEIFDQDSGLVKDRSQEVELDDDTKYLILDDRCFYREKNVGDICFPASASVRVRNGDVKRMDELQIGDEVEVGGGKFSPVFAWTHRTRESARYYIKIETEGGLEVIATSTHYVYAGGEAVPARKVKVGDVMMTGEGDEVKVVKVGRVREKGLYNPQTLDGDIVVNGLVVTTYTTTIEPMAGHALLAPVRAVYSVLGLGLNIGVSA